MSKDNLFARDAARTKKFLDERGPIEWIVLFAVIDGKVLEKPETYTAKLRYEAETLFQNAHGGYVYGRFRNIQIVEKSLYLENKAAIDERMGW